MEYSCWRYVAERRTELGLMTEMEPQGWRQNGMETDRREVNDARESLEAALPSPCEDDAMDAVHLKAPPKPPTTDITTPGYYRDCPLTKLFFSLFQAQ